MSSSPLRLGVDLLLVCDPGVRFGVEGAARSQRGVVGMAVASVMGITDGVPTRVGFSPSSGNWSVRCGVEALEVDQDLVVGTSG